MAERRALRTRLLYTGKPGELLRDVYIVWEGNHIVEVTGEKPADAEILDVEAGAVTPAFIDAHSHIGMDRAGEPWQEGEANEHMDSVLPMLDALYSIYMDDPSFRESVEWGVLYSSVLPGSGNIIGGKSVLIRNYAPDIEEAFIKYTGVKAALGYNPRSTTDWKGTRPYTRMGVIALLRKWLIKTRDAMKLVEQGKKALEEIEPEIRALFPVLRGEERLRVHVHKEDDIAGLIMLLKEFGIKATIEHAGDAHTRRIFEKIKKAGIPLVYGPVDAFPYKTELKHESWRNIRHLVEVKPFFGLMSDHPVTLQRNLHLQLRLFLAHGMTETEAISIITLNNAKILGVEDRLGTIEPGKWASLVAWSGDPFHMKSKPILVVGEGRELHREA